MTVTLIGPGGAGKTTVGDRLARRLGVPFVDLDRRVAVQTGDISDYIERCGYRPYAHATVATYAAWLRQSTGASVIAMSSGFMTYPGDVHPELEDLRAQIEKSPSTFVLLPSLDREVCVTEIVRRQLQRPFARTAEREAAVIRERFGIYTGLHVPIVETLRAPDAVVDELVTRVQFGATTDRCIVRSSSAADR